MFAGLFRTLVYIVAVWVIWRWLDRNFGGRKGRPSPGSTSHKFEGRKPDDSGEGEYVDFEEVKD